MTDSHESESDSPHDSRLRYTGLNETPGSAHDLVINLVPRAARVLEFGPATGYMSRVLRDRLGCRVTGVELVPEAAKLASQFCERVIVGDAETIEFSSELHEEQFDAVLFADVLEHFKDPAAVLERIRPFIAEDGLLIASIPNIAHGSVRLALLSGEFRYRQAGLLDETHLRFFTRESIQDLFESCGYVVSRWQRARLDVNKSEISVQSEALPDVLRDWLQSDLDATTYQFVVTAVPAGESAVIRELRKGTSRSLRNLEALRCELEVATGQVAETEAVRAELDKVQAEAHSLVARVHELEVELKRVLVDRDGTRERELGLRSLLLEAHAGLAQRDEQFLFVPHQLDQLSKRQRAALRFPRSAALYRRIRGARR
jgi:O-antigen biosynthesis protein